MAQISGQTVLVTGASRGIGAACANALAAAGARLVVCSRRAEPLQELVESLRTRYSCDIHSFSCDVSSSTDVERTFSTIPPNFAAIDILVNNAGLSRSLTGVHEQPLIDIDEMVDTNVKGLLYVTRKIVPGMVDRGRGHVINIGSTAGHEVYPGGTVYCSTKHAVGAITRGLKIDLHGTPVRVTTVDPGLVETDFSLVRFRGDAERAARVYADTRPLVAEDVAEAVIWCLQRPDRVNISEVIMTSVDQSSATLVHRTIPAGKHG
jgi:serine 3-dehydrogenase